MRDDRDAQRRRKFKYRLNEAYVKKVAIKSLNLNKINSVYCLVPILKGVTPPFVYHFCHRKRAKN